MRRKDATLQEIADAVGLTRHAVAHFCKRHGATYGIAVRRRDMSKSEFDKQWHGVVPCGHWSITKSWSSR